MVKNLNRRKFIGISMAAAAGVGGAGLWRILGAGEGEKPAGKPGDENGLGLGLGDHNGNGEQAVPGDKEQNQPVPVKEKREMPKRTLGRTGFQVGLFSLGGEATVQIRERRDKAVEIIHRALDLGVNYIDTAPTYGGGGSEENIGEVMRSRREEVFLASKTGNRTYDGTMRLIEQSLERLQTDYLDLY